MKENAVERKFRVDLESLGFKALKLETPGHTGSMDRLVLRPKWSPGPPWFVELKRPGKHERRLQEVIRDDWRARGALVWPAIDTYEGVSVFVKHMEELCAREKI